MTLVLRPTGPRRCATGTRAQSEAHRHGSLFGVSAIHLWHGVHAAASRRAGGGRRSSLRRGAGGVRRVGVRRRSRAAYTAAFLAAGAARARRPRRRRARGWTAAPPPRDENSDGSRYWRARAARAAPAPRVAPTEALEAFAERTQRHHAHVRPPTATVALARSRMALDRLGRHDEAIALRRGGAGRRAPLGRAGRRSARRCGSSASIGASEGWTLLQEAVAVLERSPRAARARQGARRRSAPRCGAGGGRPTPASRSRRALELADACCGRSARRARALRAATRPARGRARRRSAGSTR